VASKKGKVPKEAANPHKGRGREVCVGREEPLEQREKPPVRRLWENRVPNGEKAKGEGDHQKLTPKKQSRQWRRVSEEGQSHSS